jgi:thiol-disulfide isomerase/thioredoxin
MSIQSKFLMAVTMLVALSNITGCSTSTTASTEDSSPTASVSSKPVTNEATVKALSGGLAAELQGKPVVVDVYASWCPSCKIVAPILEKLKKEYAGKANFVVLDVTDQAAIKKSTEIAKNLGLEKFFEARKSDTGMIAIMDPSNAKILVDNQNNTDMAAYRSTLDSFVAAK